MINKKAVAILGAILLLIIGTVGFLLYQRSQNKTEDVTDTDPDQVVVVEPTPTPEPTEEVVEPTPEPTIIPQPSGESVKLTEVETLGPVLFYQGNGIAFLNAKGQLFQADLQENNGTAKIGNLQELVIPQRSNITKVLWPNSGNNFMIERTEIGEKRYSVYVSDKGEYVDLPKQVISAVWMPGGQQILYVWAESDGKSTLNIANADNTGWVTVTDFWEPDNAVSVSPDGRSVAFYQSGNQTETNKLNLVTIDGKVFKSAVKDGLNYGALWSPDSRFLAFAKLIAGRALLHYVNLNNGDVKSTDLELSSLDQIVWSADSKWIYGGSLGSSGQTELYKLDVATGEAKGYDVGQVDIREPFLNSTGTILFFRNASDDNKLYYVGLSSLSN